MHEQVHMFFYILYKQQDNSTAVSKTISVLHSITFIVLYNPFMQPHKYVCNKPCRGASRKLSIGL